MAEIELDDLTGGELRSFWNRYLDRVRPFREPLHAYCRRLTRNLWDAEDLLQDTLIRGFHATASNPFPIENPRGYLLRIASHLWIDRIRRLETERRFGPEPAPDPDGPAAVATTRDAGRRLMQRLAPREQAAVILKDLFDLELSEIARVLGTTPGAVKSALHRGRERLRDEDEDRFAHRASPSPELVDRFVELFNAGDHAGLTDLVLENAAVANIGPFSPQGGESPGTRDRFLATLASGHADWPAMFVPKSERMERAELDGACVVLLLREASEELGRISGVPGEAIEVVMRLEELDGRVSGLFSYAFCPETMRAVGEKLGRPVRTGLYRPPEPGELRPA